jgi:Mn2+/Fe2+ NRAMP family transporter
LKAKNKSFIEDVVILFILGIIIYFIYSFFFSTEEKVEIVENKTTIEKKNKYSTPKTHYK